MRYQQFLTLTLTSLLASTAAVAADDSDPAIAGFAATYSAPEAPAAASVASPAETVLAAPSPSPEPFAAPAESVSGLSAAAVDPDTGLTARGRADPFALCGAASAAAEDTDSDEGDESTYLSSDEAESVQNQVFNFKGNVAVRRGDQRLNSDAASYNKLEDTVEAEGNVRYREGPFTVETPSAKLNLGDSTGVAEAPQFQLSTKHARGDASLGFFEGKNHIRLLDARFTTCNQGNNSWYLHSSDVALDFDEGVGRGRNVWVDFKNVPIFYFPYVRFPLDDRRKTGFLTPSFGASNRIGFEIREPFYWNIAPNRDATLTTRATTRRGVQLLSEFRYLNQSNSGEINLDYLPYDPEFGSDREFFSLHHQQTFTSRLTGNINYNYVSDKNYFRDLGTTLNINSRRFLESNANLNYRGNFWTASARVQGFETVDNQIGLIPPYARLPQLTLNGALPKQVFGTSYLFNAEYVNFQRDAELSDALRNRDKAIGQFSGNGERVDITPGISLPLVKPSGFITPSVKLRFTQYQLRDFDNSVALDTGRVPTQFGSDPSRALPIFSLDSGLFFERNADWGARKLTQTLEPRLYYLYVPFEDQTDLPVFDSALLDFNYSRLFQTNRFSGGDRQGDANQVALALTSRLLNTDTGAERLSLRLGQLFYLQDRKVLLPGFASASDTDAAISRNSLIRDPDDSTDSVSDFIAEVDSKQLIRNWDAKAALHVDPQDGRIDRGTLGLRYQPQLDRFIGFDYRYRSEQDLQQILPVDTSGIPFLALRRDLLHQSDISALWPLAHGSGWELNSVGRWNFSLDTGRTLEVLGGLEYNTCCYAVRVAGRSYIDNFNGDNNTGVFVQLELKGLTRLGNIGGRNLAGLLDARVGDQDYLNNR